MSKNLFTSSSILKLQNNKHVLFVSSKSITFTPEFRTQIAKCETITSAKQLLIHEGFDLSMLGERRVKSLYKRVRAKYLENGSAAFVGEHRGRKKLSDSIVYSNSSAEEKLLMAEKRIKEQEEEIEMLKKFIAFLPKSCKKATKFNAIQTYINRFDCLYLQTTKTIKILCSYLGVSVSGYYKYIETKNSKSVNNELNKLILRSITKIQNMSFRRSKSKFKKIGYRQVTAIINRSGEYTFPINHKRIYRLMKNANLLSEFRQKDPYKAIPGVTTEHKTYENLLDGNFDSPYANNILCTDITYLICNGFKAYLSAVKDSATGKIISYKLSTSLHIKFVIDTIKDLKESDLSDETLIHTDQGSHYSSPQFSNMIRKMGITQSMSRRGKCTDNAPIESFFGHLKCEAAYEDCTSLKELEKVISEYIKYYNYERPQVHKKKMTPHEYECHLMYN